MSCSELDRFRIVCINYSRAVRGKIVCDVINFVVSISYVVMLAFV